MVRSEFRLPENQPLACTAFNPPRTSYSAHNPTLTPSIAFSTWHSGGFQAIDITNPAQPDAARRVQARRRCRWCTRRGPAALDCGRRPPGRTDNKVVMWSYPVIQDGLIYTVDLRNGLYILKYNGPYQQEVDNIGFLEGNSNQGDALCLRARRGPGAGRLLRTPTPRAARAAPVPATLVAARSAAPASFGAVHAGRGEGLHGVHDRQRDLVRR